MSKSFGANYSDTKALQMPLRILFKRIAKYASKNKLTTYDIATLEFQFKDDPMSMDRIHLTAFIKRVDVLTKVATVTINAKTNHMYKHLINRINQILINRINQIPMPNIQTFNSKIDLAIHFSNILAEYEHQARRMLNHQLNEQMARKIAKDINKSNSWHAKLKYTGDKLYIHAYILPNKSSIKTKLLNANIYFENNALVKVDIHAIKPDVAKQFKLTSDDNNLINFGLDYINTWGPYHELDKLDKTAYLFTTISNALTELRDILNKYDAYQQYLRHS